APKVYLSEHRLVNLYYAGAVHLVELIYTVALAVGGQIVAKLLAFTMGVIATLGVFALGSRYNARVGLWAAALFYSTPLVSWLSSCTYIDLIVGMFVVTTLLAFLRWRDTNQFVWLIATGFLAGAAVGAKLTALFGLPIIGTLFVWELLRNRWLSGWIKMKNLAAFTLSASVVCVPYFVI